jgi:succinate dehydrogenase/fumarate reductase cytochrome b subunit
MALSTVLRISGVLLAVFTCMTSITVVFICTCILAGISALMAAVAVQRNVNSF